MISYDNTLAEYNLHFEVDNDLSNFERAYFSFWENVINEDRESTQLQNFSTNWPQDLFIQARCIEK